MARTTSPRTNTTKKTTSKKTAAKKTTTGPRTRKQTQPRLSLVKPAPTRPTRALDFIADSQIYAVHAARQAGLPTHRIRDWTDHRDGTATRRLNDGTLHYNHTTRTLTWQATCRMGAVHTYAIPTPAASIAARVFAARCTTPHHDLTTIPPLTPDELADLGIHTGPTWARPDAIGDAITQSIPVPTGPITRATASATDTQPINTREIADGIAARADQDQPKEHPHG
ncbi:hypothetical protein OIE75_41130 (plasmid) [Streptomyces sp. NBC_01723]|uniref:hypothetical protein n=1 Tax=Streptomyces sp. NBC_01723 TaxID=2975921 RepID=UPI002E349DE9|nr:hypothetical protein [Streptomyces sp. NBC_01723]